MSQAIGSWDDLAVADSTARGSLIALIKGLISLLVGVGGLKDNGPYWTSVFGVSGARFTSADQSGAAADITDAPTSGQKLVITDLVVSADTAMRVDFKEATSGTVIYSLYLPANGSAQITPRGKVKLATADKKLQVQTSASGNIIITAVYFSEA